MEELGHAVGDMTGGSSLEHLPFGIGPALAEGLEGLAICIDLIGVALILFGFAVSFVRLMLGFREGVGLRRELMGLRHARTTLATYILTGLEFMIASDIIHTVITRELADLLFVGLLVMIRTAISFFLGREAAELRHEKD
ncbi:MAG: DUF1622 domain-containing protein [Pseudomonadota bacterium]